MKPDTRKGTQPDIDPAALSLHSKAQADLERKRELLAKVRLIREGQVARAGRVTGGKPDYVYFWVYNHPQEIDRFLGMMAEIVDADDPVTTSFRREDGRHVRGDTILLRMHKDLSEAYGADRDLRATESIEGHKEDFLDWAAREAVPAMRT